MKNCRPSPVAVGMRKHYRSVCYLETVRRLAAQDSGQSLKKGNWSQLRAICNARVSFCNDTPKARVFSSFFFQSFFLYINYVLCMFVCVYFMYARPTNGGCT